MPKDLFEHICEEQVFAGIFKKHAKDLHDFLYYKFGEHINAEDQVQNAFLKLWDNCAKVSLDKSKSFLFTVANNLAINLVKHQKVKLNYQNTSETKTSTNQDPEFILEEKQYLEKYKKALANLTEAQRIAFLMNRVEGKKHQEIADVLGISRKAVEKRIYGALEKLRKEIEGI